MNSRELEIDQTYDEDTYRLLDITLEFLVRYFGHSEARAMALITSFHRSFADEYDEDSFHYESSYRLAAIIHYLVELHGERERLGDWLHEEGHQNPPAEAAEYFRDNYFVRS